MEEKKSNGISASAFFLIIAIIVIIAMGYFIYKFYNDKEAESKRANELQAQVNSLNEAVSELQGKINSDYETSETPNSNTKELALKKDSTKDWVYDAEYAKNVTTDSYSTYYETYYAKDIIVPYININSTYANNSNSDIKKIFDEAINTYNTGVSDKITYVDECNYKKYINDNSISVVLTYGVGATDVVHPKYYTYNIDLKTGNQLSYEEVCEIAGFDSDTIISKVESAITEVMKNKMLDFSDDNYPIGTTFDTYNNESIDNYKNSIDNNELKYFLSDDGKLNIIVKLSIPAGTVEFDTIITIK